MSPSALKCLSRFLCSTWKQYCSSFCIQRLHMGLDILYLRSQARPALSVLKRNGPLTRNGSNFSMNSLAASISNLAAPYRCSTGFRVLLAYAMGTSRTCPSRSCFCERTPAIATVEASVSNMNIPSSVGNPSTGSEVRISFSLSNADCSSSPHCQVAFLRFNRDRGAAMSAYPFMNSL